MRTWTSKEIYVIILEAVFLPTKSAMATAAPPALQLARTELSTRDAGPFVDGRLITVDGMTKSPLLVDRAKTRQGST